ncbi:MAG TPA: hypothetical protein VGS19_16015 [Streptosporangiaceae bacterium]|nr:hypothetical protein [Streptosporangiaceae bacterium]
MSLWSHHRHGFFPAVSAGLLAAALAPVTAGGHVGTMPALVTNRDPAAVSSPSPARGPSWPANGLLPRLGVSLAPARVPPRPGFAPGRWGPGVFDRLWRAGVAGRGGLLPESGPAGPRAGVAGPWRVQPSPDPAMRNSSLAADSCTSPTECTAVGSYENIFGTELTLAERWNGIGWRIQATPSPPGAVWSILSGVSCTSADACTAVGYHFDRTGNTIQTLAETWNGTHWAIQSTPGLAGYQNNGLFTVSCTSARACTAVGAASNTTGKLVTLAETWNGTHWAIQPTPDPSRALGAQFNGVSCASPNVCTAVGFSVTSARTQVTLAETWDGTHWAIQPTPNPAGSIGTVLFAVSCPALRACTATGNYSPDLASPGVTAVLAEAWNGKNWHIQPTPSPAPPPGIHSGSELLAVSCTSPRACTAAGSSPGTGRQAGIQVTLAEAWDGTRWAIQPTASPAHSAGTGLSAVSCTSAGTCVAAGSYVVQLPLSIVAGFPVPALTLAEAWNGTRWDVQPTRNRTGAATYSEFNGVSCTSAQACTAAGDYVTSTGLFAPLAERWNGMDWAIQPTPNPARNLESFLDGVSCTSARACTAVGFSTSISVTRALAERWNGTRWAIQPIPRPAHAGGARLFGVSCASVRRCIAVGDHLKGPLPLAEEWDGARWRVLPVPVPTGTRESSLSGISCFSARNCTAVGEYTSTSGRQLALAESWNGSHWSVQATARPSGTVLSGVSCTSLQACTAVGSHTTSTGGELTLAERWNGQQWAIQPTPSASSFGSWLNAVSCASARACTALGAYHTANGATVLLADAWNGTRWEREPAANPAGAFDSSLSTVSCASSSACTGAGWDLALSNVTVTLAVTLEHGGRLLARH